MAEYRWNVTGIAAGYDAAATHIHPHYNEIQEKILHLLEFGGFKRRSRNNCRILESAAGR